MNKKKLIFLIIFLFLIGGFFWWQYKLDGSLLFSGQKVDINADVGNKENERNNDQENLNANSEKVLIDFSTGFKNKQLEMSLQRYFINQEDFSKQSKADSWRHCTIKNLENDNELFPYSIWIYCGEYIYEDNSWQQLSEFSGPVKVDYPNELSYFNPSQFEYEAPAVGSYYSENIKEIFSLEAQQNLTEIDVKKLSLVNFQFVINNHQAWESIKQEIADCNVNEVFQAHNLQVGATLNNGIELEAVEPKIDEIINLVIESECQGVRMATE